MVGLFPTSSGYSSDHCWQFVLWFLPPANKVWGKVILSMGCMMYVVSPRGCVVHPMVCPGEEEVTSYIPLTTETGGTHPTRMLSCFARSNEYSNLNAIFHYCHPTAGIIISNWLFTISSHAKTPHQFLMRRFWKTTQFSYLSNKILLERKRLLYALLLAQRYCFR